MGVCLYSGFSDLINSQFEFDKFDITIRIFNAMTFLTTHVLIGPTNILFYGDFSLDWSHGLTFEPKPPKDKCPCIN